MWHRRLIETRRVKLGAIVLRGLADSLEMLRCRTWCNNWCKILNWCKVCCLRRTLNPWCKQWPQILIWRLTLSARIHCSPRTRNYWYSIHDYVFSFVLNPDVLSFLQQEKITYARDSRPRNLPHDRVYKKPRIISTFCLILTSILTL